MDVSQAGVTGFEPVFTVLETVALPLNYAPMERKTRFELATPSLARRCSTTELFPHASATNISIRHYRVFVNTFFEKS